MSPPPAATGPHAPVMLEEVLQVLRPFAGALVVDGTFGAGGYTRAILDAANCEVLAVDRDPRAIAIAKDLAREYPDRLTAVQGVFGDLERIVRRQGIRRVDAVVLDLGVSSMQLDEAARGFSFRNDAPLDMRMSQAGPSAADVVNTLSEVEISDILHRYGEERRARQIAREIVAVREDHRIETTAELADIVRKIVRRQPNDIDPATRTFMALRIYVNDELGQLERGLHAAERLLAPGGRLAVVSFHSLEDRIVKIFLRDRSGVAPKGSRHAPDMSDILPQPPSFELVYRQALKPGIDEIERNPRARSARLRAAVRTADDPWPSDFDDVEEGAADGGSGGEAPS